MGLARAAAVTVPLGFRVLSDNAISTIEPGAFSGLNSLEQL